MILVEFDTITNKHIAFSSNGVLSIKHKNSDLAFSKISREQAYALAANLEQWANVQAVEESVHW